MTSHAPRTRRNPVVRLIRIALLLAILGPVLLTLTAASAFAALRVSPAYRGVDTGTLFDAFTAVSLDLIDESPRLEARRPSGPVPLCSDVADNAIKPLRKALGLMRGTSEGRRLFAVLVDNGVCVTVRDLPYNAAYAESRRNGFGDWSGSSIVVDRDLVRSTGIDVLAAVLVHEATHIDRAVSGQACFLTDSCVRLANGVEIDEEVAAHAAEARWWIDAYGADGKRFAFRDDYGENQLAAAYRKGDVAFHDFVARYRSDTREGEGIDDTQGSTIAPSDGRIATKLEAADASVGG